ncbi:UDP-glucuronic acid decarboxylase 4-like [Apium graveolens]|uniref:UDP-glucuronic acid decarboxylase 4-like n=1 Tax=Apium graveolens TaxID=4045 RepID=UPI003D79DDFC
MNRVFSSSPNLFFQVLISVDLPSDLRCPSSHIVYDEGKRTAETLSMDYHRGLNLEALRMEPLMVYGDGNQTRIFH